MEGVVLSGSKNVYKAQVDVTIVGILEDKIAIGKWLTHRGIPHQDISTGESKLGYVSHRNSQSQPGGSQSSRKSTSAPHNYQVLSEEDVIKQLDGIWEQQDKEISDLVLQSEHEMLINAYLKSPLYPHQRQGLAWMLSKELDTTKLPIFYEERKVNGQTTFFHSILKYDYQTRPSNIQGGLLCDDMGKQKNIIQKHEDVLIIYPFFRAWQVVDHSSVDNREYPLYYSKECIGKSALILNIYQYCNIRSTSLESSGTISGTNSL